MHIFSLLKTTKFTHKCMGKGVLHSSLFPQESKMHSHSQRILSNSTFADLAKIPKEAKYIFDNEETSGNQMSVRRIPHPTYKHKRGFGAFIYPPQNNEESTLPQCRKNHFTPRQSCTGRNQHEFSKSIFADFVEEFPQETKYACQEKHLLLRTRSSRDTTL